MSSRGNARQNIVEDDRDCTQFLTLLAHVIDREGWLCHAYYLMDTHFHLLLEKSRRPHRYAGYRASIPSKIA
jgi:hypothetical protein